MPEKYTDRGFVFSRSQFAYGHCAASQPISQMLSQVCTDAPHVSLGELSLQTNQRARIKKEHLTCSSREISSDGSDHFSAFRALRK